MEEPLFSSSKNHFYDPGPMSRNLFFFFFFILAEEGHHHFSALSLFRITLMVFFREFSRILQHFSEKVEGREGTSPHLNLPVVLAVLVVTVPAGYILFEDPFGEWFQARNSIILASWAHAHIQQRKKNTFTLLENQNLVIFVAFGGKFDTL